MTDKELMYIIEQRKPFLELLEEIAQLRSKINRIRGEKTKLFAQFKINIKNYDIDETLALDQMFQCMDRLHYCLMEKVRETDRKEPEEE